TTYVLGGDFAGTGATGDATGVTGTLTYALIRQSDKSLYLSGNFTHKTLNDELMNVSFADREINLGTVAATYDTFKALWIFPLVTSTTLSLTNNRVSFNDPFQEAVNILGADTVGAYTRMNLNHTSTLAFTDRLSLNTNFRAQKSFGKNSTTTDQFALPGWFGTPPSAKGPPADSGYIITTELKYALPAFTRYQHSVGLFTDVGGVWLENPSFTTTQKPFTQLNDVGVGYYASYEYMPTRFLLLKAMVAHTVGNDSG